MGVFSNQKFKVEARQEKLYSTIISPDVEPMLAKCWPSVVDAGPTFNKHLLDVLCLPSLFFCSSSVCMQNLIVADRSTSTLLDLYLTLELNYTHNTRVVPHPVRSYTSGHIYGIIVCTIRQNLARLISD